MTIYDIVEDLKEKYGTTDPFELCEYLGIKVSISPLGSLKGNVIKLRKNKIVTGIRNEPVTIFMNIM